MSAKPLLLLSPLALAVTLAQAQVESGRIAMVDARVALNPVSYWLDRPLGQPRPAAIALATQIAAEAGLSAGKLARFLRSEARAA